MASPIPGYPGYEGWGTAEALADFAATGGRGKEDRGGGDGQTSADVFQPFFFSREERERQEASALEKLRPYYEEVLAEAQGDVNRAKKIIEEDYQLGKRFRQEDLAFQERGFELEEPREREALLTEMNRRQTLRSTIRTQEEEELEERQTRRREAIRRALGRREELAGIERKRGIEEIDIKFPRFERELEQEKRERAFGIADIAEQKRGQRSAAEIARFITPERFNR